MKRLVLTIAILMLLPAVAAAKRIDERVPLDEGGTVEVSNISGIVEITGWDKNEVQITGELGDDVEELAIDAEDDYVRIEVKIPSGWHKHHPDASADLYLRVPHNARLEVGTVSADILVDSVHGVQRLHSVSGDIDTELSGEDAQIKTVSGDVRIDAEGTSASLTVTTVSGDARISGIAGDLMASVVSGDLHIDAEELERVRMKSVSGTIDIRTGIPNDARFDFEAISGDIEMSFRGDVAAEFDLRTFSGDIDDCFGNSPRRSSKYGPGWQSLFTEGDGNGRVTVNTMSGDIECR